MPVVVVASFTAKPESVDLVRAACTKGGRGGYGEPGCDLYRCTKSMAPSSSSNSGLTRMR